MSYIGAQPTSAAFITDQYSGTGAQTAFTMSVAPATTASILVSVSGVLQDPSTYSINGTTLTFSAAPPSGTGNISVRYLGIPASGVTTTAYRTVTEFTATSGQTTYTPPSYTVGYINVFRNGVRLGSADFTATNGTTIVLASAANVNDIITTESFYVSSVVGAIPATTGSVTSAYIANGSVLTSALDSAVPLGYRNRIINGAMTIDQRNSGSAQTGVVNAIKYVADRWYWQSDANVTTTIQQVTDAPAGFTNSIKATVTTTGTPNYAFFQQALEGYNVADITSGNSGSIVISFWVKSSVTGTYTANIHTGDYTWTYNATYTVNSANTWEYKTVPITWSTNYFSNSSKTNGSGLNLRMCVSVSAGGTPNTWVNSSWNGASTATNWASNSGATFQLAGVQIEKGTIATPFEYRSYGVELHMCQRYYEYGGISRRSGNRATGTLESTPIYFKAKKRANPTLTFANGYTADGWGSYGPLTHDNPTGSFDPQNGGGLEVTAAGAIGAYGVIACTWKADAEF